MWLQDKCYVFMWQEALKNSEDKMARLKQQWEAHKQPLEEQLSQLNLEVNKKKVWMLYYTFVYRDRWIDRQSNRMIKRQGEIGIERGR